MAAIKELRKSVIDRERRIASETGFVDAQRLHSAGSGGVSNSQPRRNPSFLVFTFGKVSGIKDFKMVGAAGFAA